MATLLIKTKLSVPVVPPSIVSRRHLLSRLTNGMNRRLTLVCAPAGYGKTTLLSEWTRTWPTSGRGSPPVAWLSLSEQDNSPQQFWTYFTAALQRLCGEGFRTWRSLECVPSQEDLAELIRRLSVRLARPSAIVLDDYQVIGEPVIHQQIGCILDNIPERLHLVIAGRNEPPLPVESLRQQNQLVEIRTADLRFSPQETGAFLRQVMGLEDLSGPEQEALHDRTEGWVAGLKLAALALQGSASRAGLVRSFSGNHWYIADYLADQVLNGQSPEVRQFLLETSILERLNGYLCDAVTGQRMGQARLHQLAQSNSFLFPLDQQNCWYRYHPLFAEFLRARLRQAANGQAQALYRRAALWCEQNGLVEDSIHYSLAAGDGERAAALIGSCSRRLLDQGRFSAMRGWLSSLPAEFLLSRADLCIDYAWSLVHSGQLEEVEPLLLAAEKSPAASGGSSDPSSPAERRISMDADLLRAAACRSLNPDKAVGFGLRALERAGEADLSRHSLASLLLGQAFLVDGRPEMAERHLAAAAQESRIINHPLTHLRAIHSLAQMRALQGRLGAAMSMLAEAAEFAHHAPEPVLAGIDQIHAGEILREWNRLPEAAQAIARGLQLAGSGGDVDFQRDGHVAQARLEISRGNLPAALQALDQAEGLGGSGRGWEGIFPVEDLRAVVHLKQGSLLAAESWAQRLRIDPDGEMTLQNGFTILTLARLRMAQGRWEEARRLLDRLLRSADSAGWTGRVIEILVLLSLAHQSLGNNSQALLILHRALTLAEPEGYLRTFVDEGWSLSMLLSQLLRTRVIHIKNPSMIGYIQRLLSAFTPVERSLLPHPSAGGAGIAAETLSQREVQILRLIASGMSYEDAARQLVVAVSTVQWHIKNIYQKLNAHSAMEAVALACRMGILQPEQPPQRQAACLVEPLSQREVQILRLIANGMSYEGVARELVVAVSTIQWHIKNIYQKLNVHSGMEAVALARQMEILPSTSVSEWSYTRAM